MDPENDRVIARTGNDLCTEVTANGYSMVVDEPAAYGGTDAGPTPYHYLLAALGSCTAMTVRMYADRKEWPLGSVRVRTKHSKIHAQVRKNFRRIGKKADGSVVGVGERGCRQV